MGRVGRSAEDDNKKKRPVTRMPFFLVKLFQRVKRLSSLQRHFSIFKKTEFRLAFLFFLRLMNS